MRLEHWVNQVDKLNLETEEHDEDDFKRLKTQGKEPLVATTCY